MGATQSLIEASVDLSVSDRPKLEDLARRLSGELDIKLDPDEKHHGISAQTWLSGENDRYEICYSHTLIYEGGPSNDEDGGILIERKPVNYPRINISSFHSYDFSISVPDFLIRDFMKRYSVQPLQLINPLHRTLALRVAKQISEIELSEAQSGGMVVYNFGSNIPEDQLSELNGKIVEYFLVDS